MSASNGLWVRSAPESSVDILTVFDIPTPSVVDFIYNLQRAALGEEREAGDMTTTIISGPCAQGLHGFCQDAGRCECTDCHLGPCARCGADNLLKMYDHDGERVCAGCVRAAVKAAPAPAQTCDQCGSPGAFRNPAHRRNEYLCTACHAASGEPVVLTSSVASLAAPCKGADISDDRHSWVHIRGSRFNCLCGSKKYDSSLRTRRNRELEREMFTDDVR